MWEAKEVTITIRLPHDIADQAKEVQKVDPEFLSRVVLYGLTRRSIYHSLRERSAEDRGERGFTPAERAEFDAAGEALLDKVVPIEESEGRRILAENRHYDDELEDVQRRSGLPVQRRPVP